MTILRKSLLLAMATVLMALPAGAVELNLSFDNLMPLNESTDGLYEGWAIIDGMPVSTGVFNVDDAGNAIMPGGGGAATFMVPGNIGQASAIKISLEPVGDMDPAPSGLIRF